jgi:hypothetical protein
MPHLQFCMGACMACVIAVVTPSCIRAQSSYDLRGHARSTALAHATTALASDVGVQANPATRSTQTSRAVTFFARQSFGIRALRYGALHVVEPRTWGALSAGAGTFGTDAYREVHLSAGIARGLRLGTTRRLHGGLALRYYHTRIEGYGQAGALGIHLGLLVRLLDPLHLGVRATNVNVPEITSGEPLPRVLALGLSYAADRRIHIVVDASKDVDFPLSFRGGLEVRPIDAVQLRTGVASNPTRFTAGVGVVVGRLRADVAAEQHQELGWSPAASLSIHW